MRIGNEVACDIFNSCVKNPYVATLASGQSAPGFLEFMGSNAVQTGKVKISFDFVQDEERSYIEDMYACDKDVNGTLDGYEVEPCTCNYCETACKPSNASAYPAFFDGFDLAVVLIVYAALIVLSVIIFFLKKKYSNEKDEASYSEEISGDDPFKSSMQKSKQRLINDSVTLSGGSNSKARINKSSVKESTFDNHNGSHNF